MILAIAVAAIVTASAQNNPEQELLQIISDYDKAYLNRDAGFFNKILADDYFYSGSTGETQTKAQAIEELKKMKASTSRQMTEMRSENVTARVVGNTGIVTGAWVATGTEDGSEPHTDRGRFTTIFEKRNGKWLVVTEHVSENQHDRKLMEQQVMKAGQAYNEMLKRNDIAGIERTLAANYIYTTSFGAVTTREQEIARHKGGKIKFEIAEATDQKVRVIGNGAAVETATIRVKGTNEGKPFDETERYTTTWIWRDNRWQIVSDHTTTIKK